MHGHVPLFFVANLESLLFSNVKGFPMYWMGFAYLEYSLSW